MLMACMYKMVYVMIDVCKVMYVMCVSCTVVFVCLCKVMYARCCIQDNVDGMYVQDDEGYVI